MDQVRREQWAAASGFVAIAFGAAAAALERPWPTAEPVAFSAFIVDNRGPILAQSMLFALGAGAYLWFLGSLRSFLMKREGGAGRLSTVAFGAGFIWAGINVVGQAPQIALTLPSQAGMRPELARLLADLVFVILTIANIPLAIMFCAIAALSFRTHVFPTWLGWLSVLAAAAALLLSFAVVEASGPLAPQGWLTLALYPASAVWLIPASILMIKRTGTAQVSVRRIVPHE